MNMVPEDIKRKFYLPDLLAKGVELFGPLLDYWEKPRIKRLNDRPAADHPVFIIGTPRSGSTLLYQTLVNYFDLSYISNATHIFARNLYLGFSLFNRFVEKRRDTSLDSNFGKTLLSGWLAPSECPRFWYRHLPKNTHYLTEESLPKYVEEYYHDVIYAIINKCSKPLLFKNLNAGQRIRFINSWAPHSKFIFIKRDPLLNAQSIFFARRSKGLTETQWWSVKPYNFERLLKLPEHEMIIKQIYFIEKQIFKDKQQFPESQFLTISYEDYCNNFKVGIEKIQRFLGPQVNIRSPDYSPTLKSRTDFILSKNLKDSFQEIIDKLDWENYVD